ncbi:TetR/AcrR family transcriptional regulator [Nonomuraea sp. NPDC050790]|uniref:TetR/AcrR family transcriptional regulator n=1 Tax=Nonomuraea sp. NPDC050790 TaxID=3364371 RepID=UPI0037B87D12
MDTKAAIIEAVADLLARSPSGDVSTRAMCEAVGVQQPVLYRLFNDKDTLLAATVDHVWGKYLEVKRAAKESDDPLEDLRAGWDSHTAFALANPNIYRLMFSPALRAKSEAAEEAMGILRGMLERLAVLGRLRVTPEVGARMIMSANTGVALALITHPAQYPDAGLSVLVRDAIHQAILLDSAAAVSAGDARRAAATTLVASLDGLTPEPFNAAEAGLLGHWLTQIAERR